MRLRFFALSFSLLAFPAHAVDFTQPLLTEDGKPMCMEQIKETETCPADKSATLGRIARFALNFTYPDEKIEGEEKFKRWEISQALTGAGDVKIKIEDRALLKKLIGKLYPPNVVGPTWSMLEK